MKKPFAHRVSGHGYGSAHRAACIDQIEVGDAVLSCTDGLWAYFSEDELAKMAYALTPADACKQLLGIGAASGQRRLMSLAILKATAATANLPDERLIGL